MAEHSDLTFDKLHESRLERGDAVERSFVPEGDGDAYYAEDTETLSIGTKPTPTSFVWNDYALGDTIEQLADFSDVDSAAQTANYVLTTPDGSTGNYSGRALVADDIPSLPFTKFPTSPWPINKGGTNISTYAEGNLLSGNTSHELSKLTASVTDDDVLIADSGLSSGIKWGVAPVTGLTDSSARAFHLNNQTGMGSDGDTLDFTNEQFDTDAFITPTSDTFTIPSNGCWLVTANLQAYKSGSFRLDERVELVISSMGTNQSVVANGHIEILIYAETGATIKLQFISYAGNNITAIGSTTYGGNLSVHKVF